MTLDALNYAIAWPEIFLLTMACVILVVDVFLEDERRNLTYLLSQITLLATCALVVSGGHTNIYYVTSPDGFELIRW